MTAAPICITGMHRAGTSMVAHVLRRSGLWLGPHDDLKPAAPDNPEGFFEHVGLVSASDQLLEALGGAWDCPPPLPADPGDDRRLAAARLAAEQALEELRPQGATPWGWKDPRVAVCHAFWAALLPELRVIVCVRNPLEVAVSLHRRNGLSYAFGLQLWTTYLQRTLDSVAVDRRLVVHYDAFFGQPERELDRLATFTGVELCDGDVRAHALAAIAKPARHSRLGRRDLRAAGVSPGVVELYERLCDEAAWFDDLDWIPGSPTPVPTTAGTPLRCAPATNGSTPVHVHRATLDHLTLLRQYHRRGGQVAVLERRIAELEAALHHERQAREIAEARRDDDLREMIGDLRLDVAALRGDPGIAPLQDALRCIRDVVPAESRIISIGADARLATHARPKLADLPADASAILLDVERALGAEFLLVAANGADVTPAPALLDHLNSSYASVAHESWGQLFDLRQVRSSGGELVGVEVTEVLIDIARALDREPSIVDWHSGLDLACRLAQRIVVDPPQADDDLPYLDSTFDVVAIGSPHPARLAEAQRVARTAVLVVAEAGNAACTRVTIEWQAGENATRPAASAALVVCDPHPALDADAYVRAVVATVAVESPEIVMVDPTGGRHREHCTARSFADAVAATSAAVIAVIDGTTIPTTPWLASLQRTLDRMPEVGAVTGRVGRTDGSLAVSGGPLTERVAMNDPDHSYIRPAIHHPGAPLMARREALTAALAVADTPARLGDALAAAGVLTVLQPEASFVTIDGAPAGARP